MGVFAREHPPKLAADIDLDDDIFRLHSMDPYQTTKRLTMRVLKQWFAEEFKKALVYKLAPIATTAGQLTYAIGDLVGCTIDEVIVNNMLYRSNQFSLDPVTGILTLNVDAEDIGADMELLVRYYKYV